MGCWCVLRSPSESAPRVSPPCCGWCQGRVKYKQTELSAEGLELSWRGHMRNWSGKGGLKELLFSLSGFQIQVRNRSQG